MVDVIMVLMSMVLNLNVVDVIKMIYLHKLLLFQHYLLLIMMFVVDFENLNYVEMMMIDHLLLYEVE
jgi:hypothetical protein